MEPPWSRRWRDVRGRSGIIVNDAGPRCCRWPGSSRPRCRSFGSFTRLRHEISGARPCSTGSRPVAACARDNGPAASPGGRLKPMTMAIARVRPLLMRSTTATGSPSHVSLPSETTLEDVLPGAWRRRSAASRIVARVGRRPAGMCAPMRESVVKAERGRPGQFEFGRPPSIMRVTRVGETCGPLPLARPSSDVCRRHTFFKASFGILLHEPGDIRPSLDRTAGPLASALTWSGSATVGSREGASAAEQRKRELIAHRQRTGRTSYASSLMQIEAPSADRMGWSR